MEFRFVKMGENEKFKKVKIDMNIDLNKDDVNVGEDMNCLYPGSMYKNKKIKEENGVFK